MRQLEGQRRRAGSARRHAQLGLAQIDRAGQARGRRQRTVQVQSPFNGRCVQRRVLEPEAAQTDIQIAVKGGLKRHWSIHLNAPTRGRAALDADLGAACVQIDRGRQGIKRQGLGRNCQAGVFSRNAPAERGQLQGTVQAQIKTPRARNHVRGKRKVRKPQGRCAVDGQVRCAAVLCNGAVDRGVGAAGCVQHGVDEQRFTGSARRASGRGRTGEVGREQADIAQIGGKADDIVLVVAAAGCLNIKLGRIDGQRIDLDRAGVRTFQNGGQIGGSAHQLVHGVDAGTQIDGLAPDVCGERPIGQIQAAKAGKLRSAAKGLADKTGQGRKVIDIDLTLGGD